MTSWDVARLTARLGDHNIRTPAETSHIERKIKRVVRHRGFDMRTLVRLSLVHDSVQRQLRLRFRVTTIARTLPTIRVRRYDNTRQLCFGECYISITDTTLSRFYYVLYKFSIFLQYNDISILTIDQPVTFSRTIRPICLPTSARAYNGQEATVIGWGSLRESKSLNKLLVDYPYKELSLH